MTPEQANEMIDVLRVVGFFVGMQSVMVVLTCAGLWMWATLRFDRDRQGSAEEEPNQ